jgi:hypothetical protein
VAGWAPCAASRVCPPCVPARHYRCSHTRAFAARPRRCSKAALTSPLATSPSATLQLPHVFASPASTVADAAKRLEPRVTIALCQMAVGEVRAAWRPLAALRTGGLRWPLLCVPPCFECLCVVRASFSYRVHAQDKAENISAAERMVGDAVARGAGLVVLPECFNRCAAALRGQGWPRVRRGHGVVVCARFAVAVAPAAAAATWPRWPAVHAPFLQQATQHGARCSAASAVRQCGWLAGARLPGWQAGGGAPNLCARAWVCPVTSLPADPSPPPPPTSLPPCAPPPHPPAPLQCPDGLS